MRRISDAAVAVRSWTARHPILSSLVIVVLLVAVGAGTFELGVLARGGGQTFDGTSAPGAHEFYSTSGDVEATFCSRCHSATMTEVESTTHGTSAGGGPLNQCVLCHERADVSHAAAIAECADCHLTAGGDGDCHSGCHFDGTAPALLCRDCHNPHSGYIAPPHACTDCHSAPQGSRRQIVGAGGDFERTSLHVQPGPDTVTDSDCRVCHDVSQHQGGTVRLKDPDNPSATIEYTADAALEPFCRSCHDADGANGNMTPFSDGVPVPLVPPEWADSSHKTDGENPLTCFGDGTAGCHANAHGSDKTKLKAPYTGTTPDEEAFCYTCHDSDGPASTDVQADFVRTSHHIVDGTNGTQLECANCHNPHLATAAQPTVDPDDVNVPWVGNERDFCLGCHDGGPPASVAFPATAPGTGWDKSATVGTTHDTALGNQCTSCHDEHGSDYQSLLLGTYRWDGNTCDDCHDPQGPDPQYDPANYTACWSCHDAQVIVEGKNAFGDRHKRHVNRVNVPCIQCHDTHAPYDAGEDGLIDFGYGVENRGDFYLEWGSYSYDFSTSFVDTGTHMGECYLKCHEKEHRPKKYAGMH